MRTVKLTVDADGFLDAKLAEIFINRSSSNGVLAKVELDSVQPKRLPEGFARIVMHGALVESGEEAEVYQMMESIKEGREARLEL